MVTGSRKGWTREEVWEGLDYVWSQRGCNVIPLIVHGDAEGVDTHCKEWGEKHGPEPESHPVTKEDWRIKGRSAGHQRNSHMVSLGADIGIAFLGLCTKDNCPKPGVHYSHGTEQCLKEMHKAGIYVYEFEVEEEDG